MQAEMLDSTISSSLQLFTDKGFRVRVIMRCSDPWFVAKDIADCIEHSNVTKMCELCRDKDKFVADVEELKTNDLLVSGNRGLTCISESGLYRILAKCNLPKCKPFESWVFDEVLPSIRKTGGYGIRTVDDMINDPDTAIRLLTQLKILCLQNKQLAMERDEAIRTKSMIGSRREATATATASAKSRECAKLTTESAERKDAVGRGSNWRTVAMMRAEWKHEFGHAPDWHKLMKFSDDLPTDMQPAKDVEEKVILSNGREKINLLFRYHREAWAKYREYEENLRISARSCRDAKVLYLRADHTELEYF